MSHGHIVAYCGEICLNQEILERKGIGLNFVVELLVLTWPKADS